MVYVQSSICNGERDAQTPLGFRDTTDHLISDQTTRSRNNQQQKRERTELWTLLYWLITE